MRVLITGAGSYLGEAIRAALLKSGVEADELDVTGLRRICYNNGAKEGWT